MLSFCDKERSREDVQSHLKLKDRKNFRTNILFPLVNDGLIEMTIPDKPRSSKQKYRTTEKGKEWLRQS